MEALCTCQKVLLVLGTREMDLNEQIWPKVRNITWENLKTALDQLATKGLAIKTERKVEGNRVASFYTLTSAGQIQKSLYFFLGRKKTMAQDQFLRGAAASTKPLNG